MFRESVRQVASRDTTSPKTALGFFALVLGLALAAGVPTIAVLSRREELHFLIPWVLGFFALLVIVSFVGIFAFVVFGDPSKLMLGQVTGTEYRELQRMLLGDSSTGVRPAGLIDSGGMPQIAAEGTERRELRPGDKT